MVIEDRDALMGCICFLPRRGLHILEGAAHYYPHILSTHSPGRPAAVHCRIAATKNQNTLTNTPRVLKCDAGQPVDAQIDI